MLVVFAGVDLLGRFRISPAFRRGPQFPRRRDGRRRIGVLRRRDGRRRIGVLRPRTSPAIGWAPSPRLARGPMRGEGPQRGNRGRRLVARLRAGPPWASPSLRGWAPSLRGECPQLGHGPSGVSRRPRGGAPSPRLARGPMRGERRRLAARGRGAAQFAQPRLDFAFLPWRRGRRRRGSVGPLGGCGRVVHDIADRVLGHRQPRGLRLVGRRTCGGDPRRARARRGVGSRRGRDPRRRTRP
jgi:hypothetical protein